MSQTSPILAEYIWIDGAKPTNKLRSKTKVIENYNPQDIDSLPEWAFDGSSTYQAPGNNSDRILNPVFCCPDPIRGKPNILVMCEVFLDENTPDLTNTRAFLKPLAEKYKDQEAWFGIEQEYTFFKGLTPLGFPSGGFPQPQGPYYCGVGADEVFGRKIVEEHLKHCLSAGLKIGGINAEVMPGQWEFQIGPLGPLEVADQLWIARWLLYRTAENYEINVKLHPKPVVDGDWNGAGAHTNFSTKLMREPGGMKHIEIAIETLQQKHDEHIAVYGADNHLRLTGKYETAPIEKFRWGIKDRGASIRIPLCTAEAGYGYFEDRRPSANMDPYLVCRALLETVCGNGFRF